MSSLQGKGNFQKPNLCFGGTWKFSPKIFSQTNNLYISKSLQEICCSFFEALSINESFHLNYSGKTVVTTELFSFLSLEKNHSPCRLISFTGLNRHTETNDNYCKLKKSIHVKASRPLVFLLKWKMPKA